MAEMLGFVNFGGTGIRGEVYNLSKTKPEDINTSFRIGLDEIPDDDPYFLQVFMDSKLRGLAQQGEFTYGGVTLGVDGPEVREYGPGIFESHKTGQIITAIITAAALDCPAEAMNDVMAMAHGLKTVTTDEMEGRYIIKADRNEIQNGFRGTRAKVITVGSGLGGSLFISQPEPDGTSQILSTHSGHQGWQPDYRNTDELEVMSVLSRKQTAIGASGAITVEQAVSGGNILAVASVLEKSYASNLLKEYGDDFDAIGRAIADDAPTKAAAEHIMEFRAGVLGTAVRDYAATLEAQAVVLTGGGMNGLEPFVRAEDGLFQQRVKATYRAHAYRPPHVINGPQDLDVRGGIERARELAIAA